MKRVLLVSALLAVALGAPGANAYALQVETVSVTESGGIVSSGQAEASASEDASASVRSVISGGDSNVQVHISVEANADGERQATSVSKTLRMGERFDMRVNDAGSTTALQESKTKAEIKENVDTRSTLSALFDSLARFFDLVFFWW